MAKQARRTQLQLPIEPPAPSQAVELFKQLAADVRARTPTVRDGTQDKEFHFQRWVGFALERLNCGAPNTRNRYPDFVLDKSGEGFEVKGLEVNPDPAPPDRRPKRIATFDANSCPPSGLHVSPSGLHVDLSIWYVFGRYYSPDDAKVIGHRGVLDLVLCHGSFLDARVDYEHHNTSFGGFGSYGDLRVRDRKMYIAPTPYALLEGTIGACTLVTPADYPNPDGLVVVGEFGRREVAKRVAKYSFDMQLNALATQETRNPTAGTEHWFRAWRVQGDPGEQVRMHGEAQIVAQVTGEAAQVDVEADAEEAVTDSV